MATDKDLGQAREDIADHLEPQQVSVVTPGAFDAHPAPEFDLCVFVQGRWWDQGLAANLWAKFKKIVITGILAFF